MATFLVYLRTLAPGVHGLDSAELATGVFTQGIIHPTGYPLYLLIGKLFTLLPMGDVAYRLNLMSAFFGSLTVWVLYRMLCTLLDNWMIAWVSAGLFAFSNYFWQMALVAEVYTLHTALLAINIYLLILWVRTGNSKILLSFALLFGLSLTNHISGLFFAPGFAWIILRSGHWQWRHWKQLAGMVFLFLLGLSVYLYLPWRAQANPAINYVSNYYQVDLASPTGLWWMLSGQAYRFFSFGYVLAEIPREVARFISYLWRNFLGAGVIIGLFGLVTLARRRLDLAIGLSVSFLLTAIFYINYRVADKDTMFLATYLVWAVFLAVGLQGIWRLVKNQIPAVIRHRLSSLGILIGMAVILLVVNLNWRWVDMSSSQGYARFAQDFMAEADADAVVIAPWSQAVVLEYMQLVEGKRPDLVIINSSRLDVAVYYRLWLQKIPRARIFRSITEKNAALIQEQIKFRTVYSLEYNADLAKRYEYLPDGAIYRLATRTN